MLNRPALGRNPLTLAGIWLTTLSALAFATYFALETFGFIDSPYSGLIGFIAIPLVFVAGLLLIPAGVLREARRRRAGRDPWHWPAIDLDHSRTRTVIGLIVLLTVINVALVTVATVGAAHYMETDKFCGLVCHVPMKPEFTAHQTAAHANVACVSCHIAPGAGGMVRAKMNGARQAYEYLTNTFHRPIPTPARNIPAAAETCVRCHTPGRAAKDAVVTKTEYDTDESNSETTSGIVVYTNAAHWHVRPDVTVEYAASDGSLETIPYVRLTQAGKPVVDFTAAGSPKPASLRRMDCLDCHNRPAHSMTSSANAALDKAIASGEIPKTLRFVKRESLAVLTKPYPDERTALEAIGERLTAFYSSDPAVSRADVDRAIASARRLYSGNVFPEMSVTWETYKSRLGHPESTGCFRCHDDEHKSADGRAIRQDCELCHKDQ
jgi:hypothetical protein